MSESASAIEVSSFYAAALCALRHIEQQRPTGRRFGEDADARWASFRGDLDTAARIDLMLRDADAQWPRAFGAQTVFGLAATAEDEPFGTRWTSLDAVDAERLWRQVLSRRPPTTAFETIVEVGRAWKLELVRQRLEKPGASDGLVVAGPSAVASLMEVFQGDPDLDWPTQVSIVATPPAHRQIAAIAGAMLGITKPTKIVRAGDQLRAVGRTTSVVSDDAADDDARSARELVAT